MTDNEKKVSLQKLKDELSIAATGMTRDEAHARGVCIECKKAPRFYSDAGRKEYRISGMCEYCFDALFAETDEEK